MLGGKFKFVSVDDVKGTNKENKPFHFANVTLSDGLESKTFSLDLNLVEKAQNLKRAQDIIIVTDEVLRGYNHQITVKHIQTV